MLEWAVQTREQSVQYSAHLCENVMATLLKLKPIIMESTIYCQQFCKYFILGIFQMVNSLKMANQFENQLSFQYHSKNIFENVR